MTAPEDPDNDSASDDAGPPAKPRSGIAGMSIIVAENKSIEVTSEMERAGVRVLEESGLLDNGLAKRLGNPSVIRDIFTAMIEARAEGVSKMHSGPATAR